MKCLTIHTVSNSVTIHRQYILSNTYFDFSLTVLLSITLVSDKLDAQIFHTFITILYMYNTANYIIVILDNSPVFRVTIPDAVLIQFDLLRMSKILLETCTCRGL